jgi:ribosomal protein S18 acetylase RimI-like enzyme
VPRERRASGLEAARSGGQHTAAPDRSPPLLDARPHVAYRVRVARLDDLETVLAFRLALLREHAGNPVYGRLRSDAPERARRLFATQLTAPGEVTLLAERPDGCAVGVLRCMESRGSPLLDPPRYGYLASVYVVPAARRTGVLRALLDAAMAWCAEHGLDEMRLHTAADNDVGNAAWEALGFGVVEHLRTRAVTRDA